MMSTSDKRVPNNCPGKWRLQRLQGRLSSDHHGLTAIHRFVAPLHTLGGAHRADLGAWPCPLIDVGSALMSLPLVC